MLVDPVLDMKPLTLVKCGFTDFNYSMKDEIKFKGIEKLYCIKEKQDFKIGGSFRSSVYQTIAIISTPCRNSTDSNITCATE